MKNKIFLCLISGIFLLASCTVTKQVDTEKTHTKTDSTSITDIVEKIDTTATIAADTATYNNLPLMIFTDTTDITPVILENDKTKLIIKKKKNGKVDIVVIKKEEKVHFQFERRYHNETHLKKAVRTSSKEVNTKTSYGPMFYIVPGICLLILALIYYLYRRWKKGLL